MKQYQTPWFAAISKTRRVSSSQRDGFESKRSWAARLGVDVNAVIGWERGALPRLATVKQIVERLDLPTSEYYRLVALLDDSPPLAEAVPIPVYKGIVSVGPQGHVLGELEDTQTLGTDIMKTTGATTHIVAFKLDASADSMEPVIPRGALVFVDTQRGREWHSFRDGSVYAIVQGPDLGSVSVTFLQHRGDDIWLISANKHYPPERAWTNDLGRLVVGWVFHYRGAPIALRELDTRESDKDRTKVEQKAKARKKRAS
jgi:phage repressor protein C with HTH and peptisase S24 domain